MDSPRQSADRVILLLYGTELVYNIIVSQIIGKLIAPANAAFNIMSLTVRRFFFTKNF